MSTNGKGTPKDWRGLAEKASKETDPEKLMEIVEDLCGVLKLREAQGQAKPVSKKTDTSVDD